MTMNSKLRIWGVFFALLLALGACTSGEKTSDLKSYEMVDGEEPQMMYGKVKTITEKRKDFRVPDSDNYILNYKYTYGSKGELLEIIIDTPYEQRCDKYQYNDATLKVACLSFKGDSLYRRADYNYASNSLLIEEKRIGGDEDNPNIRYFYDDKGRLSKRVVYIDDAVLHTSHYIYDASGRLERELWGEAEQDTLSYQYNDQGQLIGKGYKGWVTEWDYNDHGFIDSEKEYYGGELSHCLFYRYTYDKQGNWTKQEIYKEVPGEGQNLQEVITREITYY